MITNEDSNHDDSVILDDIRREANDSEALIEHDSYHLRPTELRCVVVTLKPNQKDCYFSG